MLQLDVFLLILRLLFIVLLYLFLMQVVIAITRDLKVASTSTASENSGAPVLGHLVVIGGSSTLAPGTRFNLMPETSIGRGPANTIQLTDSFISGVHTELRFRNNHWHVIDANSRNGTYINNQKVEPGKPLIAKPGDTIQIGFIQFQLTP